MKSLREVSGSRGAALVLVLTFIVLVTITAMAFFSRALLNRQMALSSSGQMRAVQLADAALETLIGDLRAEMAAASSVSGNATSPVFLPKPDPGGTGVPVYRSMVPLRVGVPAIPSPVPDDFPSTWIRRSTRQGNLPSVPEVYDSLALRAGSALSSSSGSPLSGGGITAARWNRHFLLPQANPASSDPTPTAQFVAPDWMYVTRAGIGRKADGSPIEPGDVEKLREQAAANPDFVIGRIAYAMYDLGGLIDINAAGYVANPGSGFDAIPASEAARKGSPGLYNLSVVEGVLDPSAIVRARNAFSAKTGSFSDKDFPSPTAPPYLKFLLDGKLNRGFAAVFPGDQTFLNRQDLIRFAKDRPGVLSLSSLRHLTAFQRSLDAPSWSPSNPRNLGGDLLPRQNNVDYETQGNATSAQALAGLSAFSGYSGWPTTRVFPLPNRNPLRAVIPNGITSIMDWDGMPIPVTPGEPLPLRRFPLSRLDLFRQHEEARKAGQSTAEIEQSIRYSFGLIPDPAAPNEFGRWLYVNRVYLPGSGTGQPDMRLMTLDEVASATVRAGPSPTNLNTTNTNDPFNVPRLPNFFEVLQAAILHGDVGYGSTVLRCNETRLQEILQLGANVIDQYDSDHHPTFIRAYAFRTAFGGDRSRNHVLVGKENLPQFSEILLTGYRPNTDPERRMLQATLEFEIWNPHQNAGDWTGPPVQLRLAAEQGAAVIRVSVIGTPQNPNFDPNAEWLTQEVDFSTTPKYRMTFEYPTAGSFADPTLLSPALPTIDNASRETGGEYGPAGPYQLFGFHLPALEVPDSVLSPGDERAENYGGISVVRASLDRTPVYELQYLDTRSSPPVWKTYNSLVHATTGTGLAYTFFNNGQRRYFPGSNTPDFSLIPGGRPFTQSGQRVASWSLIDPRRTRFEVMGENPTTPTPGASIRPRKTKNPYFSRQYFRSESRDISVLGGVRIPSQDPNNHYPDDLVDNTGATAAPTWFIQGYDGIRRETDASSANSILPTTNSSMNWFLQALSSNTSASGFDASDVKAERLRDRPVHLNRPFQSVAELGYVFAEQPWKTLDFRSHLSPHVGLLDWFTLNDYPKDQGPVGGGFFNLNSMTSTTMRAALTGAGTNPLRPADTLSPTEISQIIENVQAAIAQYGPFRSRAEMVAAINRVLDGGAAPGFPLRKTEREAVIRALSSNADTRTWNLFIDVIAQSGRLTQNAAGLEQFQVQGECRVWLSVAIDRLTGKVLARNLERVYE